MQRFVLFVPLFTFILCPFSSISAQQNAQDQEVTESPYCAPRVDGMPRSKGVILNYERIGNFSLLPNSATSNNDENGTTQVASNTRKQLKVRLPIYNKDHFKFLLGYDYALENFDFSHISDQEQDAYSSIEQKTLRKMGLSAYVIKPFIGNKYLVLRTKIGLSGNFHENTHSVGDYLTYSVTPLFGWKKSNRTAIGLGFSLNNTFGRFSLYPLLAYNHTFNKHWGIEATLPASIRVRWTPNPKNLFYVTVKLDAASYRLSFNEGPLADHDLVEMRRTELKYFLTYEREIHDFLWFGVSAGYRTGLNFNISADRFRRGELLQENKVQGAPFLNFSVFLVPPKKFLK